MMTKLDFFWESEYKFGEYLSKIFGDQYKRKYSLIGNGIYNLLFINNKIYEVKYTQAKQMLKADNHKFTDDKEYILTTIVNNLKHPDSAVINGGKFATFPVDKWIGKVEIIKKLKMPV